MPRCSRTSGSLRLSPKSSRGSPEGPTGQGSYRCQGAGQAGGQLGHPQAQCIRYLHGDRDRLRPGWDICPQVQPSSAGLKVVRAGLWESLEPASYSIAGAGTDGLGLSWNGVLGPWVGHGWRSQVRMLRTINTCWCSQGPDNVGEFSKMNKAENNAKSKILLARGRL